MAIKITNIHDFTQTLGTGEQIHRAFMFDKKLLELSNFGQNSIKNLKELRIKKENSISHRLGKIIRDLEELGKILAKEYGTDYIDPIEYIIQLYFKDNLSIEQVFERVNGKGIKYKGSTGFAKLLTLTFEWRLKDAEENKTTRIYKQRTGEKSIAKPLERKDQRKAEFLSWFIQSSQPNGEDMDHDIFESFDFKYKKFIYLVANVFHISKENFLALQKLSMGNQSLADRWNEQFENYKIDFQVSHKDVARAFEKLNHQQ